MSPIWHLRAFRLWFLLYLPAALLFAYQAFSSAVEISNARQAVAEWIKAEQQKVDRGERKAIKPIDVQFAMLGTHFERLYEQRNIALAFLIGGLSIPGFTLVVKKLIRWVWVGRAKLAQDERATESAEQSIVAKYLRWYKWASVIAVVFAAGLLFAPESMAKATVSSIVQALAFVVVAWVFIRLKEWWVWRKP